MKREELIARLQQIEEVSACEVTEERLLIQGARKHLIAYVTETAMYSFSTSCGTLSSLSEESQEKLLTLLTDYARTPIYDREEPALYKLRHRWIENDGNNYLCHKFRTKSLVFSDGVDTFGNETILTGPEWEEVTGKDWYTLLQDFEELDVIN